MLRTIRIAKGLKQREAANLANVAPSSWANAETGPHAVIGKKRVEAFAEAVQLDAATRLRLLRLHADAPLSPFQERQRERFAKAKAERAAFVSATTISANLELLKVRLGHLEECLARFLEGVAMEGDPCECDPEDSSAKCLLCLSLEALGLSGPWNPATAVVELEKIGAPEPVANSVGSVDSGQSVDDGAEFG